MYQIDEDMKLSENFTLKEFACKDGSKYVRVNYKLIEKLQILRNKLKCPITIVSGYRTPSYNDSCGGAQKSQHMYGTAADIQVSGMTPEMLYAIAQTIGFNGMGIYDNFIHVDVRPLPARWDERVKNKGRIIPTVK